MATEFEIEVVKRLSDIHEIVKGLDELNRNIEKQTGANLELNRNIEKLIKILVEKESKRK